MHTTNHHIPSGSAFNEELRDLWNQYILIQEQLLKETLCADKHRSGIHRD